jgi:hypothetical protein
VSTTSSGVAQTDYRRALATRVHRFTVETVSQTPSGPDAARMVACDGFRGPDDGSNPYAGGFLYVVTGGRAGEQRRVRREGYWPEDGILTLDRPFSAPLAATDEVEWHEILPPIRTGSGGRRDFRTIINRALATLRMPQRITVPGANATYRFNLSTYPWLSAEAQLGQVLGQQYLATADPWPLPGGGALRFDADATYLITGAPVATGTDFSIDLFRPRASWVRSAGTWANSVTGLVSEADAATAAVHEVELVGLYWCYDALLSATPHDDRERRAQYLALRQTAAENAAPFLTRQRNDVLRPPVVGAYGLGENGQPVRIRRVGRGGRWP